MDRQVGRPVETDDAGAQPQRSGVRNSVLIPLAILAVFAVALIVLRLMLPDMVRDYINDRLAELENYDGQVEEVELHLWRGAYSVRGVEIVMTDREVQAPFVTADNVEFTISWEQLLDRRIVSEAVVHSPVINFVDLGDGVFQAGEGIDWRELLEDMMPIEIDHLRIVDGRIHYRNFDSDPQVDVSISEIEATVVGLSTAERNDVMKWALIEAQGLALNHAPAELTASVDPLGDFRDFEIQFRVSDIDLTGFNPLTEAYADFDFQAGTGSLVMELVAIDAQLSGYARPLMDDVEIFDFEERMEEDGLAGAAWEGLVAFVSQVLRNQPEDRLAAEIEITGELDDEEIDAWQAFVSILRNAFVEAYTDTFGREDS